VFRALRFERRFGFHMDPRTLSLLKNATTRGLVDHLPGHRVRKEVMLLLAERHPARTIRRMASLALLSPIHPKLILTSQTETLLARLAGALAWWGRRFPDRSVDQALVSLMALLEGLDSSAGDAVLDRFDLPGRQADKIRTVKKRMPLVIRRLSGQAALKPSATYRLLDGLPDEGLALLAAKAPAREVRHRIATYLRIYQRTTLAISGKDLALMGLREGPAYKTVLDTVMNAKLNGTVTTENEELALARRFIKKMARRPRGLDSLGEASDNLPVFRRTTLPPLAGEWF
jgi:tRNA nucleotidyltransferase (CCA-adding enzyme)